MKRVRLLVILLSGCLLLSFAACGRTEGPDLSDPAESAAKIPEPDEQGVWYMEDLIKIDYPFPVEGLYGQPQEELKQTIGFANYQSNIKSALDTGTGVLLSLNHLYMGLPVLYNKSAGSFSLACPDPLCDHSGDSCLWGVCGIYPAGDQLLFVDRETSAVYLTDLAGSNPRRVYEDTETGVVTPVRCGDYLFYTASRNDPEQGTVWAHPYLRIPLDGGDAEVIMQDGEYVYPLPFDEGRKVMYIDPSDENCYIYDIKKQEKTLFGSGILPYALYNGCIYYTAEDGFYRVPEGSLDWRRKVLDDRFINNDEVCFVGYRLYYLHKTVFSESEQFGVYYQWELYSSTLGGDDQQLIRTFEGEDGIPATVRAFWTDGNYLLVNYEQYWNYKNEFNPHYKGSASSSNQPTTYAMIDLSTGEQVLFSSDYRDMLSLFVQSGR